MINTISNYLNKNINNININKSINDLMLSNFDAKNFYNFLNIYNKKLNFTQEISFLLETNIYYKFCKTSICELLLNPNTFYHQYTENHLETAENRLDYNDIYDMFEKYNIKLSLGDIKQNQNYTANSGYHFLSELNSQLAQNFDFGTNILYAINDPQIECTNNNKIKKLNLAGSTFSFDDIYIGKIYDISNIIVIKEIFQEMAKINEYGETQMDVFYRKKYNISNITNGFDALINRLKYIEFFEKNSFDDSLSKMEFLNLAINNIDEIKTNIYSNAINFINQSKEIYLQCREQENFTHLFCTALDEICPGQLHIFDEKYQIEQFREAYGGKEFKEKFLNNLSKSISALSEKEIKKLFSKKTYKQIIIPILEYNKQNPNKQIPILMLVNDFKELDKKSLNQLEFIINKYKQGQTEYLYDYLVRQEELDMIIEKSNITLEENIKLNTIKEKLNNKTKDINKTR